ncbi:MAG: DUF177 domain-containing protein [Kiritimatiellae bacterium]|nr:DUF177 domain-containing protein [Kiritimatiellia bacterium]
MIIEISKLSPEGSHLEGDEPVSILDLENDQQVRPKDPLRYRFFVQVVSQKLVVQGVVEVELEIECARCTDFYSTTVADSSFLRAYDLPEGAETVDVTPDIREDILLNLPHFPLCKPDCRGLCPQCGKNLNEGKCGCRPPSWEGSWEGLDKIKL